MFIMAALAAFSRVLRLAASRRKLLPSKSPFGWTFLSRFRRRVGSRVLALVPSCNDFWLC